MAGERNYTFFGPTTVKKLRTEMDDPTKRYAAMKESRQKLSVRRISASVVLWD